MDSWCCCFTSFNGEFLCFHWVFLLPDQHSGCPIGDLQWGEWEDTLNVFCGQNSLYVWYKTKQIALITQHQENSGLTQCRILLPSLCLFSFCLLLLMQKRTGISIFMNLEKHQWNLIPGCGPLLSLLVIVLLYESAFAYHLSIKFFKHWVYPKEKRIF